MSDTDTQTLEWTEERCIKLIREFKSRPILWDPKDPLYYKKAMKPAAWEDIANVLNVDPEECKHKIMVLMSSFRREKSKLINNMKQSQSDKQAKKYTSTWFAFKEMVFMLDKESLKNRQYKAITTDDEEEIPCIKTILLKRHIQPPIKTKRKILKAYKPLNRQPVREDTVFEAIPSTSQKLSDRDEEINFFTSFIGNKMKNYTDVTKNSVQQAICDIIFRADQNYYEIGINNITQIISGDPLEKYILNNVDREPEVNIKEHPLSDSD